MSILNTPSFAEQVIIREQQNIKRQAVLIADATASIARSEARIKQWATNTVKCVGDCTCYDCEG